LLGIKLATSRAYHPQTNSQTKHINQEFKGYLQVFTSQCQDDWDNLLSLRNFTHNNHVHSSTQLTPFMIDTGHHPSNPIKHHQNLSLSMSSQIKWQRDLRRQRQLSQRQKTSTCCTTTIDMSQYLSLPLETKYGSMEVTSPLITLH
jgi:hypothetical protein